MAEQNETDLGDRAREKAGHLVEEGREKAEELGHRAEDYARSRASDEKGRMAAGIRTVADALRQGSRELPEDRQAYGRFVDAVADRAEGLSRYLEERDVDEIAREAKRFARENTGVVLSGAFALGLLGARFLKSSSDDVQSDRWVSRGYERDGAYEAGYRTSGGYSSPAGDEAGFEDSTETELGGPGVGRDPQGLNLDRSDDDRIGGA